MFSIIYMTARVCAFSYLKWSAWNNPCLALAKPTRMGIRELDFFAVAWTGRRPPRPLLIGFVFSEWGPCPQTPRVFLRHRPPQVDGGYVPFFPLGFFFPSNSSACAFMAAAWACAFWAASRVASACSCWRIHSPTLSASLSNLASTKL